MRRSVARLERLNPMLRVPEVSAGDAGPADAGNPDVVAHRRNEAYLERRSTEAQRLSMELALLYHRDVFCEGGIWEGAWVELTHDRRWVHRVDGQAPSRRFLFHGNYRSLKVAPDLGRMLVRRDRDQPVPASGYTAALEQSTDWGAGFVAGLKDHDPVEFKPLDIPVMTE